MKWFSGDPRNERWVEVSFQRNGGALATGNLMISEAHTSLDMGTSFSHRHALEHSPTATRMSTRLEARESGRQGKTYRVLWSEMGSMVVTILFRRCLDKRSPAYEK